MCLYVSVYLAKELMVTARVMQSSSNELSTLVSDSVKCKQTKVNSRAAIRSSETDRYVIGLTLTLASVDTSLKRLTCLATLKSCDTTKQSVSG